MCHKKKQWGRNINGALNTTIDGGVAVTVGTVFATPLLLICGLNGGGRVVFVLEKWQQVLKCLLLVLMPSKS